MTEPWDVTWHMGSQCYLTPNLATQLSASRLAPARKVTGHFGHKTLRHQDILGHFGTDLKTLQHQKHGTRHFDTSAVIEEKLGHFDPRQFRWDTAPPVIRLKLRHQFCGSEVSGCRRVLWPKCPTPARKAGTQFTYRREMKVEVDLVAGYVPEMM